MTDYYVHDVHLPTLLDKALGTVVINSTVGLSSLLHDTPVCVMGDPIYNIPGLTFQGSLDAFWSNPGCVDRELYKCFRAWLLLQNQANGNFYRRLSALPNRTGVVWPQGLGLPVAAPEKSVSREFGAPTAVEPTRTRQTMEPSPVQPALAHLSSYGAGELRLMVRAGTEL